MCGGCGRENRAGAAFCSGCGTALVRACRACGNELEADARFCDACGAPVGEPGAPAEPDTAPAGDRKVVTVVFADLSGSTSLQERLDAEATARLMERVHQALSGAVESHGGRVVKSTGDGVMAVFGIPTLREDDAVRAVQAGIAMQAAIAALAIPEVALRVGVNTGEVVVAPDSDDVVGDPVNVAARLEAAAGLGEVYVGPETMRLVRDLVALGPVPPLSLKGKAEPVPAARVVGVSALPSERETPFLGRDDDMRALLVALDEAVAARSARLATVIGWPGLGKSRLAGELASAVRDRAMLLEARFLADAGTSFGPIADAVRRAVDPATLDLGPDTAHVAATIEALRAGGTAGSTEQVFWAVRRALEGLAAQRPVVVVLDDVHWAEPAMLDLVEHLAEWIRSAPVLLLALARPELRDRRPALLDAAGPSSTVLVLGGLDAAACRQLALDALGADDLPPGVVERALEASEGNPLFLRELLRLLVDDGVLQPDPDGRWALTVELDAIELPATIHATLAARIEQLQPDERAVLQVASVVGRHFPRGAVAALLPPAVAGRLDEHLASLHRRALVDPEGTWWDDERMFRFHHVLIRDAAYRRVLKEVRADLHVRYADWLLERVADATAEHDEVLGFHLEQAIGYRRELAVPVDPGLVDRAVEHLGTAGRRALDGDDLANAAALLGRALALAPDDADLLLDRCEALVSSGDVRAASQAVAALVAAAGDERSRALAEVYDAQLTAQRDPDSLGDVARRAGAGAATLAALGDDQGVAKAESVQASALAGLGQVGACEAALDRALAAARRVGDRRRANVVLSIAPSAALWGPSPIARASGRCLDVVRVLRITSWAPHVEAQALRAQAVLEALRERPDAARRMLAGATETFTDLGHRLGLLETEMYAGLVELLAGDAQAAEHHLREAVAGFASLGAAVLGARATALLARALLDLDRLDEAEAIADPALAGADLKAFVGLLGVRAEVLARSGDVEEAERLARKAVALAEPTDALVDHADARLALSSVLAAAGKPDEAATEAARACDLYREKGATVGLRRAPATLGEEPGGRASVVATAGASGLQRRVRHNLAVAAAERWLAAWRAQDWPAVEAMDSEEATTVTHRIGSFEEPGGPDGQTRAAFRAPGVTVEQEVLASLGDRHCLLRRTWHFPEDGDRGALELRNVAAFSVDHDGRILRIDTFEGADLARATACLVECWAEDELTGGDRERARRWASVWEIDEHIRQGDWDAFERVFDEGVVLRDHRGNGVESTGRLALTDWLRGLIASSSTFRTDYVDVFALTPDAALWLRLTRGEVEGGGDFLWPSLNVMHFGPSGLIDRLDFLSPEDVATSWAIFDEYAGGQEVAVPARRLPRNLALEAADRWLAAMRASDEAAAAASFAPEFVGSSSLGALHPSHEIDAHQRMLLRAGASVELQPLAALGRRHVLLRSQHRWADADHGGAVENERLYVARADHHPRITRYDQFDGDELAEALSCLVTRWAEDELDGEERERGLRMAQLMLAVRLQNARDWETYATLYEPDAVLVDRRPAGWGELRGPGEVIAWTEELVLAADRAENHLLDVLALTPRATVWRWCVTGERDGGEFLHPSVIVARFSAGGRFERLELYPPDRLADAFTCFDTFDGQLEPATMADGDRHEAAGVVVASHRRVPGNLAVDSADRAIAAFRAGDVEANEALYAPEFVSTNRMLLAEIPLAEHLDTVSTMIAAGVSFDMEVLAALGRRHALTRADMRFPDAAHGGLNHLVRLCVVRTDDEGRIVRFETFEGGDLAPALECLIEQWAEDELDGPARDRALRQARAWCYGRAIVARDWELYRSLFSEDVAQVDHRPTGAGEVVGVDAVVAWIRELVAISDGNRPEVLDVLALTPNAALWHNMASGTSDGGRYQMLSYVAIRYGADGRPDRFEMFPLDRLDDAWAAFERFDGAGTVEPGRPTRDRRQNAASAVVERWVAAANRGDADACAAMYADTYVLERHDQHLDEDRSTWLETEAQLVGRTTFALQPIATLGGRHALSRVTTTWASTEGAGEAQMEALYVARIDELGALEREDMFPAQDLDRALACLVERWAEGELEGTARARALGSIPAVLNSRAISSRDWELYRAGLDDDVVMVDHRPTAAGEIVGADGVVRWIRQLVEETDELRASVIDVLGLTPDTMFVRWLARGNAGGGVFELPSLIVIRFGPRGRMTRGEIFPDDRPEDAWACYERMVDEAEGATGEHAGPADLHTQRRGP